MLEAELVDPAGNARCTQQLEVTWNRKEVRTVQWCAVSTVLSGAGGGGAGRLPHHELRRHGGRQVRVQTRISHVLFLHLLFSHPDRWRLRLVKQGTAEKPFVYEVHYDKTE